MHIRNEKINQIVITLNEDCTRIEKITLEPKAFRYVDGIMALLSRIFKIAPWGAIRHIVQYNGYYVVRDNAASRMVRDIK
jgi:hypothetical protein